MNQENLIKANNILSKEFNNNMNELYGTWEMHQLLLSMQTLKDLIKAMQEDNGLIKANKIYKEILKQ